MLWMLPKGCPGLPALTRAADSIGSWEKALAVGSQASALPEEPDLRSEEAQVGAWGLCITLTGAAACYRRLQHCRLPDLPPSQPAVFGCLWPGKMDPLPKLWGRKASRVESVMSLVVVLFLLQIMWLITTKIIAGHFKVHSANNNLFFIPLLIINYFITSCSCVNK